MSTLGAFAILMLMIKYFFLAATMLASLPAPVLAQGPLQQLRQADAASQSALIFSSLEKASVTAGAPADGGQAPVSGNLGVSANAGEKISPIQMKAQEHAVSTPPPSSEEPAPKPREFDTQDKISIAMVAGGVALPFIVGGLGAAAPAVAIAGLIGIVVFIAGILVGGFFKPQQKSAP